MLLHSLGHPAIEDLQHKVYEICELFAVLDVVCRGMGADTTDSDAVMKNPFQTPEMPINSSLFDTRLKAIMTEVNA